MDATSRGWMWEWQEGALKTRLESGLVEFPDTFLAFLHARIRKSLGERERFLFFLDQPLRSVSDMRVAIATARTCDARMHVCAAGNIFQRPRNWETSRLSSLPTYREHKVNSRHLNIQFGYLIQLIRLFIAQQRPCGESVHLCIRRFFHRKDALLHQKITAESRVTSKKRCTRYLIQLAISIIMTCSWDDFEFYLDGYFEGSRGNFFVFSITYIFDD